MEDPRRGERVIMDSLKEVEVNTARDALALLSRMIYKKYGD
jgi:hypothetical protein